MAQLIHWNNQEKKEKYLLSLIKKAKRVLFILPTIRDVEYWQKKIAEANIVHSQLSKTQLWQNWNKNIPVTIGTNLAIFYPPSRFDVIIIDEEDNQVYFNEQNPRFHLHDIAFFLGKELFFFSRAPLVSTFLKTKYVPLLDPMKIEIELIDMNKEPAGNYWFSEKLLENIKNKKAFLFFNRKGQAKLNVCRSCGEVFPPEPWCKKCGSPDLREILPGVAGLRQKLEKILPNKKIVHLQKGVITQDFQIAIGTEYAIENIDWTKVAIIGIISVDNLLASPLAYMPERIFGLLAKLSSFKKPILLQTFAPENPVLKAGVKQDYQKLVKLYEDFNRKK